jgi:hypothetical protein
MGDSEPHRDYEDLESAIADALRNAMTWDAPTAVWELVLVQRIPRPAAPEHDSDCAVHNRPALPAGPCNCSVSQRE